MLRRFLAGGSYRLSSTLMLLCLCAPPAMGEEPVPQAVSSFRGKMGKVIEDSVPAWPAAPKAPAGAPNVVLILLDDVGFSATSTFGGAALTPALDRLAAEGLRYNRFHTTALCSPTRAALLSGRNHHRVSFGTVTEIASGFPGYDQFWRKDVVPLPEVLRRSGYSTAAFGKWHNTPTWEISPVGPFDRWPTGLGFEYFYGFMKGAASQWEPDLYRNTIPVDPGKTPNEGYHVTTDLVDEAIRWIRTHESVSMGKPYFLYFATGATHSPHHVPREWIEKYKGKFDRGWDKLREETFARQKQLGVVPGNADLTPRPKEMPAWDSLSADRKRLLAREMEVYAAFLSHTDYEIGRLLQAVRSGPNGDNTLVLYIVGDNGGSTEGGLDGSDNDTASYFVGRPESIEGQLKHIDELGGPLHLNNYSCVWAWAAGTPFQWTKTVASHFGGTRNPLVVSWPAKIKDNGGVRTQFTHVNDVAATLFEAIGIAFPTVVDGVKQLPLDGTSFSASFDHPDAPSKHRLQYFEMLGNRAIYKDGWIAAALHAIPCPTTDRSENFDADRWELYNIEEDFSEAHDLAAQHPEKVKELQRVFDQEAKRNNVYPLLNGISLHDPSRPSPAKGRKEFIYYGDTVRIPVAAAPLLLGSHRISADIEVPASGAHGVILADGGRFGGFALYVKGDHVVYEHNFFGRSRETITSSTRLPAGKVRIVFEFDRLGEQRWAGGKAALSINGQPAGEGRLSHVGLPSSLDTLDVGEEHGSPVSNQYEIPFRFTGRVDKVEVELQ